MVSKFTIHAMEAALIDSTLILAFLRNVEGSVGLDVYETGVEEEMAVSMLMDKVKLDFDHAVQYCLAKKLGVEAIVSYDRHLDNLDVKRKEPLDFL